jgi:hypothetical protein
MSNYTKSTNFASKDSLSAGDPLKIVKGTEINTEFDNIATAVATKADLASPTFTGTPAAPTASVGTNTTQLATTALVFAAMQALYPVGTIYSNISVSTNPATLFGFGTWTAIAGRVVVGLDSGDAAFDTVGETGGSKDAVVVSHTHTATVTDSGHTHIFDGGNFTASGNIFQATSGSLGSAISATSTGSIRSATTGVTVANSTEGSSGTNANLQPYVVAYVWKRTA